MTTNFPPFHDFVLSFLTNLSTERPKAIAYLSAENDFLPVTFREVHEAILAVAGYFEFAGLKKGEVITISLPNTWHYLPCYIGAACVGGITSGMSPQFTLYETEYQLSNSESKVVFTTAANLNKVLQASRNLPKLKIVLYLGKLPPDLPRTDLILTSFDEILHKRFTFTPERVKFNVKEDLLALPYSSGTTGMPKGVMITHFNFMAQVQALVGHHLTKIDPFFDFRQDEVTDGDRYAIQFLPFYHAYGFGGLCMNLIGGFSTIIMRHFNPELLLSLVEKYKVQRLNLIPVLFNYLSESPDVDRYDLSSVKALNCGGAPLSHYQIERVKKRLPNIAYVMQGYGMTEMVTACYASVFDEPSPDGAIGKIMPGFEEKIVDPETGRLCGPGEHGELWVRGPTIMKGYWNNPKATAETITPDGFLRTGDIASVDKKGFLYIHDRIKELIKVKAFQVPPAELEHLLLSHPKVADVAVVGIPDKNFGEVPRAFVVKKPGTDVSEAELVQFVKDKVSAYKQLRGGVEFLDHILRTPTGKILRRKIKESYLKKMKLSKL